VTRELGAQAGVLVRATGRWRRIEIPVVVGLGALAYVCGVIGFLDASFSLGDSLYHSIQLFVLENVTPKKPPPILRFASFLAPLVAGYAAVRAFVALFQSQLSSVWLRRARDHVVVAGLSGRGFALARGLWEAKVRVAVVEIDPSVEAIAGCRERGIPVIFGDATDPEVLAQTGVGRARSLFATTGDDARNLDAAFSSATLVTSDRPTKLTAWIHLEDLRLWRLLSAGGIGGAHGTLVRQEFFNVHESAARDLLDRHPPFDPEIGESGEPMIGVVGTAGIGESVVVNAARLWSSARPVDQASRLRIALLGPSSEAERDRLGAEYPSLASIASLEPSLVDPVSAAIDYSAAEASGFTRASALYICLPDEKAGLVASLALHGSTAGRVPIVLVVSDEAVGAAAVLSENRDLRNLYTFGEQTSTLTPELLTRGINEAIARASHEHYVAAEREHGVDLAQNPSLVAWSDLPERLNESNRLFADGIGEKLEAAGFSLVPAPLADPRRPAHTFGDQQIEPLARLEHERWVRDLTAAGWSRGSVKDPETLRHPDLVP
jgi:voltage-gated potassium channel Kch